MHLGRLLRASAPRPVPLSSVFPGATPARGKARLTHAADHLVLLRMIWTAPKASSSIAERVSSIADELTKEPLQIEGHWLPRRHISPKRARILAKEILDLYTEAYGGPG